MAATPPRETVDLRGRSSRASAASEGPTLIDHAAPRLGPGMIVDDYVLGKQIGEGGAGTVYAATHRLIGKQAALKIFHRPCSNARELDQVLEEARTVNRIAHPNIVDTFALGTLPDGRSYIAMELLKGESLADRMERGAVSRAEVVPTLRQVCDALAAAHGLRIVHRDLKPENIFLVAREGRPAEVKLLDFGLAIIAPIDAPEAVRTTEGIFVGTPLYTAPEQALGKPVDPACDVYALGVLSYELVLDRPPFDADAGLAIISQHLTTPPPDPRALWPDIPDALATAMSRALEKDPARRPTLEQFDGALARPDVARAIEARPQAPPREVGRSRSTPRRAPRGRIRPRGLALGAGSVVAIAAAVAVFIASRPPAPTSAPAPPAARPAPTPPPDPPPPMVAPVSATLAVHVNASQARILVDGKPVRMDGKNARVPVSPGVEHEVRASAPGFALLAQRVPAPRPGADVILDLVLTARPRAAGQARGAGPPDELMQPTYEHKR